MIRIKNSFFLGRIHCIFWQASCVQVSRQMKRNIVTTRVCVQPFLFETNFSWQRRVAFLIYIFQDMISPLLYENKLYFVPQQGLSRVSGVMRPSPLSDKYSGQLSFSQICYFGFLDSSFPRHIWKVLINNDVFQIQHEIKKRIN